MSDKVRAGRGMDDRDVVHRSSPLQRAAQGAREQRAGSAETDRMGREQQRRATAYGRARGAAVSTLAYNGHDFSEHVTAELVEPAGHALSPRTLLVPGRPGAVLLGSELPPRVFRVRLFLDAGVSLGADERSEIRHELYGWLCAPDGAELELPGEPGLTWRDAVVTDASGWDSLFEDGSCEVEFTCLDPVAYGDGKSSAASTLTVGGTWTTWPAVTLTALAGSSVKVADGLGRYVLVERQFSAGDVVVMDFAAEAVAVEGADASADVAVESTFFSLMPGSHTLAFSGCSAHTVEWVERWL